MNSAVILAAGIGSRFGSKIPKQFIKINGKELLSYSVNTFLDHPKIDEVVIVVHPDWAADVSQQYSSCKVIKGGKRRQDSSLNGVKATDNRTINVLIHDAARPFVSKNIITECINKLSNYKGSAPVMPVSNSMIQLDQDRVLYLDRNKIREVQTPQCFKKDLILKVLLSNLEGTDEIGMFIRKFPNLKLQLVDGSVENIKLTSKVDLELFRHLIK